MSGALYYGPESKFAFSLEYKKATEKQRANPSQPSSRLHRGKANSIRVVDPSRLVPARSCRRCLVLTLNSPVLEDGHGNDLSLTRQVSLLESGGSGKKWGDQGEARSWLTRQRNGLSESSSGSQGTTEPGCTLHPEGKGCLGRLLGKTAKSMFIS